MPVMYILVVLARQRIIKLVDGNREFLTIDKAIGENGFEAGDDNHLDEPRHDLYYEAQSFSDILDNE
uniref:Uncharacterized protein n=1 Tax=Aegilops tauschii subsp. strangulata TaxID=200361 RepID=A0A453JZF8_AEGTS